MSVDSVRSSSNRSGVRISVQDRAAGVVLPRDDLDEPAADALVFDVVELSIELIEHRCLSRNKRLTLATRLSSF
jgi:hypothetical protein